MYVHIVKTGDNNLSLNVEMIVGWNTSEVKRNWKFLRVCVQRRVCVNPHRFVPVRRYFTNVSSTVHNIACYVRTMLRVFWRPGKIYRKWDRRENTESILRLYDVKQKPSAIDDVLTTTQVGWPGSTRWSHAVTIWIMSGAWVWTENA